jgi:hypothetical protein
MHAAQHSLPRISAGVRHTFREAAPNGGFGVWRLHPPNPALAGNACPLAALSLSEVLRHATPSVFHQRHIGRVLRSS